MIGYCLCCAKKSETDYHPRCAKLLFGDTKIPELSISINDIRAIAKQNVLARLSVTGVQSKISLELADNDPKSSRLTIVGYKGDFILKPPSSDYSHLPENEHLTMLMAKQFSFGVAVSSLIRLKSGELCYLTKRFDRQKGIKLAQEDFCQLTERLTEDKYKGSYESIGRWIKKNTTSPGIDLVRFFEMVLFSFLTGNSDMHLKNFSIQTDLEGRIKLTPAYDLLSIRLFLPEDKEELALTLNGKKNKISALDWEAFANTISISPTVFKKTMQQIQNKIPVLQEIIKSYPFEKSFTKEYAKLLKDRIKRTMG